MKFNILLQEEGTLLAMFFLATTMQNMNEVLSEITSVLSGQEKEKFGILIINECASHFSESSCRRF